MASNMNTVTDKVLTLIIVGALVPVGLILYFNVSTDTWDTSTIAIWGVISIFFIVGLLKLFL